MQAPESHPDGLSLQALSAFAAAHAGSAPLPTEQEAVWAEAAGAAPPAAVRFEQLTTAQVVLRVIKPATAAARCSYVELAGIGAPATVFVSHAWAAPFADLLDALRAHCAAAPDDEPPTVFWLGAPRRPRRAGGWP